ncbi:Hypothetical predicted protein [Xyrichtys novacula]|uniref:Uncharacterized protein n=1 Tax=Xyrichtys novacula TaxID=13765 RepID=A0AAV1GXU2_XYRNO|nr:Hypothetical predicted protein [Xyrichtys novacula]
MQACVELLGGIAIVDKSPPELLNISLLFLFSLSKTVTSHLRAVPSSTAEETVPLRGARL